jgi:GntR family transcriptional regulator
LYILDKSNHIPIFIQIRSLILDQIRSGKLKPNEQILSEARLAELYGVSRLTVRSAITELVNDGFLVRLHGKGTFVRKPRVESSTSAGGHFIKEMRDKGYTVSTEVLDHHECAVPASIRPILALHAGDSVYSLRRRRSVNNEYLLITETWLPAALCPGLPRRYLSQNSLYDTLQQEYGLVLGTAHETLEARTASAGLAAELAVAEGSPILFSTRTTALADGTPIEFTNCWFRGDRYIYELTLDINRSTDAES